MTKSLEQPADVSMRAVRALSKTLCGGAQYRIEIGAAISQAEVVNMAELADQLNIARQSVSQELRLLERVGLLTRGPRDSDRKVYLTRQDARYWGWCEEAAAEAAAMLERERRF